MTFLEAVDLIEKKVSKMGFKYPDGDPMPAIVALGKIGNFHKERFDNLLNDMEKERISPAHYFMEMTRMIHEYQQRFQKVSPY